MGQNMKPIGVHLIGRFGNQCFQYCFARKLAQLQGRELHTNPWVGQRIFQIDDKPLDGGEDMLPEHYRQDQDSLIYTRADARRWFAWRPEVEEKLSGYRTYEKNLVAHHRCGDYAACGYPVVSRLAVMNAIEAHGFGSWPLSWVSEEHPHLHEGFTGELAFVPDFYRLVMAAPLFRANSSFSYWAGVLGDGRVFSPVITGLQGGIEHDSVPFAEGNHPRLADLPFITDLHLPE